MTTSKRAPPRPPGSFVAVAGAGLLGGTLHVVLTVALAALVFAGELADHFVQGLGLFLFGTLAIGVALGLSSGFPAMLGGVQDNTSAIMAVAGASIVSGAAADEGFSTVMALFMVSSIAVGVVLVALGTLRLGALVRFLPFPVVAGLLAGTGLIIVIGSVGLLVAPSSGEGASVPIVAAVVPGLVVAGALVARSRNALRPGVIGAMILAAIVATYVWLLIDGMGRREAAESGLLLGPFPTGALWSPDVYGLLAEADWTAIVGQWVSLVTLAVLVPVTLLLYVGGFELALRRDFDGDRELRSAGLANLAAAVGAGPPGYHYVAPTLLTARLGSPTRAVPLIAAGLVMAVMFGGGPLLQLLPSSAVAGLLLFIGITFVLEWTWDARRRLPRVDMAVVVLIAIVMAWLGLLIGVALGVAATIALFVVRYSRVPVVRHAYDGRSYRSRVDRTESEMRFLDAAGDRLLVLELQAFLFFGTADRLRLRVVEQMGRDGASVRSVVLGFRSVTGMDSSAGLAFERLAALGEQNDFDVLFADVDPRIAWQLEPALRSDRATLAVDVDRAVERSEDGLLAEWGPIRQTEATDIATYFAASGSAEEVDTLARYFEERTVPEAAPLMTQGEPSQGIYFIESGVVSVEMETGQDGSTRLRTMGPGAIVGEMSLYLGGLCRATVIAQTPVVARQLTPEAFHRLQDEDPAAASALHLHTTTVLSRRLEAADDLIRSLLD